MVDTDKPKELQFAKAAVLQEKLRPPLLACRVGRLYNKEKVITAMLEKSLPPHMKHVRSLKDMRECEIEVRFGLLLKRLSFKYLFIPFFILLIRIYRFVQMNAATGFPVCPITKADLSSGVRASIIWPCGFLVSNRALEAMTHKVSLKEGSEQCLPRSGLVLRIPALPLRLGRRNRIGTGIGCCTANLLSDSVALICADCLLQDAEGARSGKSNGESGKPRISCTFVCPMCSKEHNTADDLIPLSPDEEETTVLLEKALAEQQARKASKKPKASKSEPVTPASEPRLLQHATSSKSLPVADPNKGENSPASETSKGNDFKGVPPKRVRDWVLESEPVFATDNASKQRKVAA